MNDAQRSYEYGTSPNFTNNDRERIDRYMSAIVASLVSTEPSASGYSTVFLPKLHSIDGLTSKSYPLDYTMLERCAYLAIESVKAVDKAIHGVTYE
jgi:hypothetical protein